MAAGGHFGWLKITFDRMYRCFKSICNFYFFHKMAAGGHFGWPKITFYRISRHFTSIHNFYIFLIFSTKWLPATILEDRKSLLIEFLAVSNQYATFIFFHKMSAGGHFGWPKSTFDRISRHFTSIHNFYIFLIFSTKWLPATILDDWKSLSIACIAVSNQYATFIFFTKWLPAAILDDRKSLSIAFLAISHQYTTFIFFWFFPQNGCRRPFWMTENHFWSHFSPFQINMQLLFFFTKWLQATILDDWKSLSIACIAISNQYATLIFFTKWLPAAILDDRKSLLIAFLAVSNQYATLFFFTKWLQAAILDDWKSLSIACIAVSNQYATFIFFTKWLPAAILDDRKSLSIAFLAISHQYTTFIFFWFFSQNGCRRPFWITENHFWSHFSSFQINTQLFFFFLNCRRPPFWKSLLGHFWMTENHFRSHFSPFQINTQLFFFGIFYTKSPSWLSRQSQLIIYIIAP